MKNSIDRREFIKYSIAAGAVTVAGSALLSSSLLGKIIPSEIDISVVNGTDYFHSTM
jgi:anaerobic selenocysteine-containing dehydrogenase